MGGGGSYYDRDVYISSQVSGGYAHSAAAEKSVGSNAINKALLPMNRSIMCTGKNPVVLKLDVTGSNKHAAKTIWDKLPMFFGQLTIKDLLDDPWVSIAANGDAPMRDSCPLQVCEFRQGSDLDIELEKLFLEGGGGSNHMESYDLGAWFYANRCKLREDALPFFFFLADEGVYPSLDAKTIEEVCGEPSGETVTAKDNFDALKENFKGNVFLIHLPYGNGTKDRAIVLQWMDLLGSDHVLCLSDPKAMIDVILGVISKVSGRRTHEEYLADMAERDQTPARIKLVSECIKAVVPAACLVDEPVVEEAPKPVETKKAGWL